jgi:hypothetical protein
MSFKLKRVLYILLGGLGGDAGELSRQRLIKKLCRQFAQNDAERKILERSLSECYRVLSFDSDEREPTVISPEYAGQEPETIHAPINYQRIKSYSGKEIISRLDEKPFAFLKDYVLARQTFIETKDADSEAESVRGFGEINGLISVGLLHKQIVQELANLKSFELSAAYQNLLKFGLAQQGAELGMEIFIVGSTAGGQATGLFLLVLALLGLELRDYGTRPKVRLHLALPGFHAEKAEKPRQAEFFKTLAVLRDLAKIKRGDTVLKLPHPKGRINIETYSIPISSVNVYPPSMGNNPQKYASFISQFADTLVASQLTSFAADLRRDKSNAVANARMLSEDSAAIFQPAVKSSIENGAETV